MGQGVCSDEETACGLGRGTCPSLRPQTMPLSFVSRCVLYASSVATYSPVKGHLYLPGRPVIVQKWRDGYIDGAAAIEVKVGTQLGYLWYSSSSRMSDSGLHDAPCAQISFFDTFFFFLACFAALTETD